MGFCLEHGHAAVRTDRRPSDVDVFTLSNQVIVTRTVVIGTTDQSTTSGPAPPG